jgi:S-adenosylmethionine:tRNA-ribosyltransferase-isomerase (queuine synthetase)
MRKEKELQEKLEFYNMKLIGYKGVSYDRIGSSGSRSSGDSELLYWLDKIEQLDSIILHNSNVIKKSLEFQRLLINDEVEVYINYMLQLNNEKKHQTSSIKIKMMKQKIIRIWFLWVNKEAHLKKVVEIK